MSDTEMLDLIEHYGWCIVPAPLGDGWMVKEPDWRKAALSTDETLRGAIRKALSEQARRAAR